MKIAVVKVGGSSITDKARMETLDRESLKWFAETIRSSIHSKYLESSQPNNIDGHSIIVVHGAGSFGHMQAKECGLKGQSKAPTINNDVINSEDIRKSMFGLAKVRSSVKKLNNIVTDYFVDAGINAVGISPCINILGLNAHGGNEEGGVDLLVKTIMQALDVGLCPIIHGDAGLYGKSSGILGGDTLVEVISTHSELKDHIIKVVFLTDVEGVFTKDPRTHVDATLISNIYVSENGKILNGDDFAATRSSHAHDVTGGLEAKLASAISIAKRSIPVIIAKCCSEAGKRCITENFPTGGTKIIKSNYL